MRKKQVVQFAIRREQIVLLEQWVHIYTGQVPYCVFCEAEPPWHMNVRAVFCRYAPTRGSSPCAVSRLFLQTCRDGTSAFVSVPPRRVWKNQFHQSERLPKRSGVPLESTRFLDFVILLFCDHSPNPDSLFFLAALWTGSCSFIYVLQIHMPALSDPIIPDQDRICQK